MRMESEELRNLPLHMQEQVGVAIAEQMEQATPVAGIPSGIAAAAPPKGMTYGDYIRSKDDEWLAKYLVGVQVTAVNGALSVLKITDEEKQKWERDFTELLKENFME